VRSLAPLVLTCEHATNRLPWKRPLEPPIKQLLATHWGWDIGAWALSLDLAARLKTSAIGGRWSRLVIDLNRPVDDATLVRRRADRLVVPWNEGISPAEIERRVLGLHVPYHVEVDRLIWRRLLRGVRPLLLAVHSFTHRLGASRRSFDIGILYEHHRGLAHRLGRSLRDDGLNVRYNQPYSGMKGMMYAADRHGSHHRLPCLEIEVNQRLFDDPRAVPRLGRAVARGARELLEALA